MEFPWESLANGIERIVTNFASADYNSHEAGKAREHDANMARLNSQLQQANWEKQFGMTQNQWVTRLGLENDAAYKQWLRTQSPAAIAAEARKAGINPAALVGNSGGSVPNVGVQATSPSGTGVSGGSSPAPSFGLMQGNFAQDAAAIYSSLGSYARDSATADATMKMLEHNIQLLVSQSNYQQEMARTQMLQNHVYSIFGEKQAAANFMKTYYEGLFAQAHGENEKALTYMNSALGDLYSIQGYKASLELPYVVPLITGKINEIKATIEELKSRKVRNYAEAEELRERMKVYPSQQSVNNALAELYKSGARLNDATIDRLRQLTPLEVAELSKKLSGIDWDNKSKALKALRDIKFFDAAENEYELFHMFTKDFTLHGDRKQLWYLFIDQLRERNEDKIRGYDKNHLSPLMHTNDYKFFDPYPLD